MAYHTAYVSARAEYDTLDQGREKGVTPIIAPMPWSPPGKHHRRHHPYIYDRVRSVHVVCMYVSEVNSKCILPQAASALPLPSHSQSYVLPYTLSIMSFCHPVPCLVRNTAFAAQKSLNSSPLNLPSIVVSTRGWHPTRDSQLPHPASEAQRPDTSPRVARPSP
jgi:hypothetical protein